LPDLIRPITAICRPTEAKQAASWVKAVPPDKTILFHKTELATWRAGRCRQFFSSARSRPNRPRRERDGLARRRRGADPEIIEAFEEKG